MRSGRRLPSSLMSCWGTISGQSRLFETPIVMALWAEELRLKDLHCCRRQNPTSRYYDYRLIHDRLQSIIIAREESDILQLINLLRSGLVRNLGNICTPRLFNRSFAGTKILIEDYITQVAFAISYVATLPTTPGADGNGVIHGFNSQAKLDLLHDTRQAFGRSTLVLQGGAIFGLCHLGVVKALYLRGLLPRIITGTATGALIAALVGIHTEDELLEFLNGDKIDLTAFSGKGKTDSGTGRQSGALGGWWDTLKRRIGRFWKEGYFLDVRVLEECVRANVGELTFEEAYSKTKRVLNITVATTGRGDVPNPLNYLTAPNVV
jgi:TAG lipase / lysophosphatidylethanolamine acyltransferase